MTLFDLTSADCYSILLIRHAQSISNLVHDKEHDSDSPLSERGVVQANALAELLCQLPITHLYSSDLLRATQTLIPLSQHTSIPIHASPLLREPRTNRKNTQYFDPEQAAQWLASFEISQQQAVHAAETHADVLLRLRAFLDTLLTPSQPGFVVICTHFVILNSLTKLLVVDHDPPASLWAQFDNASITRVDIPLFCSPPMGVLRYINHCEYQ